MTRALLFDLDGVVVDTEPVHEAARRAVYARHGIPLERVRGIPVIGRNTDAIFAEVHARCPFPVPLKQAIRDKRDEFVRLLGKSVTPLPGVTELLDYARGRYRTALVTASARQNVDAVLKGTGLSDAFEISVVAEDVTKWKPDPEGYLLAASCLGLEPADCVVLEDSPVGVEAAKAARMRVIGVNTGQGGASPKSADLLVNDLADGFKAITAFLDRGAS